MNVKGSQEARELKDLYKMWLQLIQTMAVSNCLHVFNAPQFQPLLQVGPVPRVCVCVV